MESKTISIPVTITIENHGQELLEHLLNTVRDVKYRETMAYIPQLQHRFQATIELLNEAKRMCIMLRDTEQNQEHALILKAIITEIDHAHENCTNALLWIRQWRIEP